MNIFLKKELPLFILFTAIIIVSQIIILAPHMRFGFTPDDVWLFTDFNLLGSNPFSKFLEVWKEGGPHNTSPLYYNGILFSFFGFDYKLYQIISLFFKIISIVSFYSLIQIVFRNKLLSFLSGLIFSFHYTSAGGLEMVTRSQDYLVIVGINIFLMLFYFVLSKKPKNTLLAVITSLVLFCLFVINPIRAYPLLVFILFVEIIYLLIYKSRVNFHYIVKTTIILFTPFVFFLYLLSYSKEGGFYRNLLFMIQKISDGNLQLILTPFATLGSFFLTGEWFRILSLSKWDFNYYFFNYVWFKALIFFVILTAPLSIIFSKKPGRFFFTVIVINTIFEAALFFLVNKVVNLPEGIKMHYDPIFLIPSTILGIYIVTLTIVVLWEWVYSNKKNIFQNLYLFGMLFLLSFIWSTWIFQDYSSVPLGLHGYATLPSMGISVVLASIFALIYTKIKSSNNLFKSFAPSIFLVLIPYYFFCNDQVQGFLKKNLDGGMKATDQIYMKNKFWSFIRDPKDCNKFIYISANDYPNGSFYDFILLDRFDKWYNLYSPYHSKSLCPIAYLLHDKDKLRASYTSINDKKGFLYKNIDKVNIFYPFENFYAFKLQDRNILDVTSDVLSEIK